MTLKGWGVTLSLAAMAWGFQYAHYGLFLVAAMSGMGFWLIEGTMKRHQMRYYFRMREIEVLQYKHAYKEKASDRSSPRIDSSWVYAGKLYRSKSESKYHPEDIKGLKWSYLFA